jgi:AraC-like DNA-binding protein
MTDPLAQIVGLLKPTAPFSKRTTGSGPWRVRRTQLANPYYCAVLEGSFRYADKRSSELILHAGDFILIPAAEDFIMSSAEPSGPEHLVTEPVIFPDGEYRVGSVTGPVDLCALAGYCIFQSEDASLLSSLLPSVVVVRGEKRLALLMQLLGEETNAQKPARDVFVQYLLEMLMIEALRSCSQPHGSPGLIRGLRDDRLAVAIRSMHAMPERAWTVRELARATALSRSGFYERFQSAVGMAPRGIFACLAPGVGQGFASKAERHDLRGCKAGRLQVR